MLQDPPDDTNASDAHRFTHAIFCTNVTFGEGGYTPDLFSVNYKAMAPGVATPRVQRASADT
jgi:hypothetical protein